MSESQLHRRSTRRSPAFKGYADLHYPWPSAAAPDAALVESAARTWILEHGLCSPTAIVRRFDPVNVGLLTSLCYAGAPLHRRILIAQLLGWIFLQDDDIDESAIVHVPHLLAARHARYVAILARLAPPSPTNAFERALDELAARVVEEDVPPSSSSSPAAASAWLSWKARFTTSMRGLWFDGFVEEARARADGITLTPERYMQIREHSIGLIPFVDLLEWAHDVVLPADVAGNGAVRALARSAARIVTYQNDVVSFAKERRAGDRNNLVHILMAQDGIALADAVDRVVAFHDDELASFAATLATVDVHPRIARGMREWIVGALDWHRRSARYQSGRALLDTTLQ